MAFFQTQPILDIVPETLHDWTRIKKMFYGFWILLTEVAWLNFKAKSNPQCFSVSAAG